MINNDNKYSLKIVFLIHQIIKACLFVFFVVKLA